MSRYYRRRGELKPQLVKSLEGSDVLAAAEAGYTLWKMGIDHPPIIPALERALVSKDALTRLIASGVLLSGGERAVPAKTSLITALADTDPRVQENAVAALSVSDASGPDVVEGLITLICPKGEAGDYGPSAKKAAIHYLGELGKSAEKAVVHLHKCAGSAGPWMRLACLDAIWKITTDPEQVLPLLMQELVDGNGISEHMAAGQITTIGTPASPYLRRLIDSGDPKHKDIAKRLLRELQEQQSPSKGSCDDHEGPIEIEL